MALTNVKVKQAELRDKSYKLADEKGLYLLVHSNGSKYWRHKYRYDSKERTLAYGVYPEVSLKEARDRRDESRRKIREGIDPNSEKKALRAARAEAAENAFELIAREWYEKEKHSWSPAHIKKQKGLMENNLIPLLGKYPITEINAPTLLACLRKIEARGAYETARRTKQVAGQIFRYGIITGRAERDPSVDLQGALKTPQRRHYPAITDPKELGALLRAIDGFECRIVVGTALKLLPMLFVRPGELRNMEWSEIDFENNEWRIPEEKMKMRQSHIVPLATLAVALLGELEPYTGQYRYVFTGERAKDRPISDAAINAAFRRMGYSKDQLTAHGFRATARTLLDEELEFEPHLIEHQLAHEVRDPLGRAYNRTKHLEQRKAMMQDWSNYLEKIKKL